MTRLLLAAAICAGGVTLPAAARTTLSAVDAERTICVATRDRSGRFDGDRICKTGRGWERALSAWSAQQNRIPGRIVFEKPTRVAGRWQF